MGIGPRESRCQAMRSSLASPVISHARTTACMQPQPSLRPFRCWRATTNHHRYIKRRSAAEVEPHPSDINSLHGGNLFSDLQQGGVGQGPLLLGSGGSGGGAAANGGGVHGDQRRYEAGMQVRGREGGREGGGSEYGPGGAASACHSMQAAFTMAM